MRDDHGLGWRMPDGEPLWAFLERHAAEEAAKGPKFAPFTVHPASDEVIERLLLCLAAFLARHPHYAPRRLPPLHIDCLETWGQWQTFFTWACQEGRMTPEEAARVRYALTWVSAIDFGGPEVGHPN